MKRLVKLFDVKNFMNLEEAINTFLIANPTIIIAGLQYVSRVKDTSHKAFLVYELQEVRNDPVTTA